jgi:group I intron endonuclease
LIGYIYQILCIKNNKKYIGSTLNNYKKREKQHFYNLETNRHTNKFLQNDYNLYSKNSFIFSIIEEIHNVDKYILKEKEDYLLENETNIYNIYKKGNGSSKGHKWTEEQRKNITGKNNHLKGKKLTEEHKNKIGRKGELNAMYGKKHTEESREKISENLKGKTKGVLKSEEHKRKISESNKGKHNHHRENNPKFKVTEEIFINIKDDIILLTKEGKYNHQIESTLSEKYNLGKITISRIRKGQHLFSEKYGSLKDWMVN